MKRSALQDLKKWLSAKGRKPLIIRGARQVGKSTLIRLFSKQEGLDLIEFNFEIETLSMVQKRDFNMQDLLDEIQFKKQIRLNKKSLIFFDEIQESPKLLKLLRYFYEQRPDLIIIAAGSLLEIALKSEDFSFPVGRVDFYHLGPMSFKEFLWATGQDFLEQKLSHFEFSASMHESALAALRNYYYVGGMPAVVKKYKETSSLVEMRDVQEQIIQTYQADFPKYNKRINIRRIHRIFNSLALRVGEKIIYSKLDHDSSSRDIRRIVELLIDARVVLSCVHSDANMVPLLGESDSKIFKTYFLDIGLLNSIMKLDVNTLDVEFKKNFSTKGFISEQFIAQHLNFFNGHSASPSLSYHLRDKGVQKAEVDFIIEKGNTIYPIEVKSTAKGHLKSLKYFCETKNTKIGIKTSLAKFSIHNDFTPHSKLINLPLYAIEYLKNNIEKL